MIVVEKTNNGIEQYDLPSRLMKDRIIMVEGEVNSHMASVIVQQLLYLDSVDNTTPITMYINTPGGSVIDGLMITDTMSLIKAPVHTVVIGLAASMGSIIASSGQKGHRYMLPHARYMIHQPSGGAQGQQTNIAIAAAQILKTRKELNTILANNSGQPYDKVEADTERDYWMTTEEAIEYGFVDQLLAKM